MHTFRPFPSPFPRLILKRQNNPPSAFRVGYGWDLPLLEFYNSYPNPAAGLAAIKDSLSNIVMGAFNTHRLCPHVSPDKEIKDFIQAGICECFTGYGRINTIELDVWCDCRRQTTLECRVCGAVYFWLLSAGTVILSLRYFWRIQKPISPGWLGMLDKQFKEKLFTHDNQYVLWCKKPDCRTNKRGRWEALIKENAERAYKNTLDSGTNDCWDYEEARTASEEGSFQNW
jgi:hypothetical protein